MSCYKTKLSKDKKKTLLWFEGKSYTFKQRGNEQYLVNKKCDKFSNDATDAFVEGKHESYAVEIGINLKREYNFNYRGWLGNG